VRERAKIKIVANAAGESAAFSFGETACREDLKRGQAIQVADQRVQLVNLAEPIELQPK
jgi:hypothetical protein